MMDQKEIIVRPILTEKMTNLQDKVNQYAFEVNRHANKIEIKRAIENRFNVTVTGVRTINMPGKKRRLGRYEGRRPMWKKAIITLASQDTIDFVTGPS
jgi:large subunit ribosomal protein L23